MELYERLNLDRINYLNKMSFDDFKLYCSTSCKNEAERKIKYEMMKKFCEINIKAKGEVRRLYAYTMKTPIEVGGRLYCGNSIQGLSRKLRGFLCKDMTDVDMKNCHPKIAQMLCKKNKIETPILDYFIENRDQICERFGENGKKIFLSALNDDKLNKKIKDDFFKSFDKECKMIQSKINAIPEYKHIVESTPIEKLYNWNGSAFNRIMCVYENKILQEVITVLNRKNISIAVLMFDGLMIYGNYYQDESLLREIEEHINIVFENLNMKFSYKEHDDTLVLPEDHEEYDAERSNDDGYEAVKEEFEKTHCKIVHKAFFIIEKVGGTREIMSRSKLVDAYMNKKFTDYSADKPKSCPFINKWLQDENMRSYDDISIYPPPLKCPKNIYNLWKPFKVSTYTGEYIKSEKGLKAFLEHTSILCNHDKLVRIYFIQWLAQMFQFPAIKTIVPALIGEEGAGKGTFMELIALLMGDGIVFSTPEPSRDVWGHFNSLMMTAFLVNLNEMQKKEAQECQGKFKALITDPTISINRKGLDAVYIRSFHRFIITSNEDEPMKTKKGDRRQWIIRISDEKACNAEYFKELRKLYEDVNVQRTIYDYLMSIEGLEDFNAIERPETEWQKDNKKLREDLFLQWVEAMVVMFKDENEKRFKSGEQLELFKNWCRREGHVYETNSVSMIMKIKRLNLPGIETGVRDGDVNVSIYNIQRLKQHFMIGCQIEV